MGKRLLKGPTKILCSYAKVGSTMYSTGPPSSWEGGQGGCGWELQGCAHVPCRGWSEGGWGVGERGGGQHRHAQLLGGREGGRGGG